MLLQNKFTAFTFDDQDGRLLKVVNVRTGRVYLDGQSGQGNIYAVDTGTADLWDSRPDAPTTIRVASAGNPASLTLEKEDGAQVLTIRQTVPVADRGTIETEQVFRLPDDSPLACFTHRFVNKCEGAVIVCADTLPLEGFVGDDLNLMWPEREGALFHRVFEDRQQRRNDCFYKNILLQREDKKIVTDTTRVGNYPVQFFSQYVSFYLEDENFYFGIHDDNSALKQYTICRDRRFFVTVWPFAEPEKATELAPVFLGCLEGDWHAAADVYRAFLINESTMMRDNRPLGKYFCGMTNQRVASYPDLFYMNYCEDNHHPTELADATMQTRCLNSGSFGAGKLNNMPACSKYGRDRTGLPVTLFIGWHRGGLDAYFPDYEFLDELGGEEGMRKGLKAIHDDGGKAIFYVNCHIAESQSKWFNQPNPQGGINGDACAVRQGNGKDMSETYDTTYLHFVNQCPMAEAWQDALVSAMERLRRLGADGIYFDQVMEMPAYLCYNRHHGHSTPATAYQEGYKKLFTRIEKMFQSYGDDYVFGCEGGCDAYMRHVDVAGMNWRRLLDSAKVPHLKPEVIRYSLPMHILGMRGWGEIGENIGSRAFILSEPPLTMPYTYPLAKRHRELCEKYPEIYFEGRFKDLMGVSALPEGVKAGVMVAADGKSADIRIYNSYTEPTEFDLTITPAGWGGPDGAITVTNAETDAPAVQTGNTVHVTMADKESIVLHVTVI